MIDFAYKRKLFGLGLEKSKTIQVAASDGQLKVKGWREASLESLSITMLEVGSGSNLSSGVSERDSDDDVREDIYRHGWGLANLEAKAGTFLIELLGLTLRVDMLASRFSESVLRPFISFRVLEKSKWFTKRQSWRLIPFVYSICLGHLLLSVYCQYGYDWNSRRLQRIEEILLTLAASDSPTDYEHLRRQRVELVDRIQLHQSRLHLLGAPHIDVTFATECIYLVIIIISLSYIHNFYYYTFVSPFNFRSIRKLLNEQFEREAMVQMVHEVVNKYITSSYNFASNFRDRPSQVIGSMSSECRKRSVMFEHGFLVSRIKFWLASGWLQPINFHPKQVAYISSLLFRVIATLVVNCAIYDIIIIGSIFSFANTTEDGRIRLMDWVIIVELIFLLSIINCISIFYPTVVLVNCLDQTKYVNKLEAKIRRCIRLNHENFSRCQLLKSQKDSRKLLIPNLVSVQVERSYEQMNTNLLMTFLHFRVFVAQFKYYKNSFGFVFGWALLLIFAFPLLGRLHLQYVDLELNLKFKLVVLFLSCTALSCNNLCLIPACYTHSRCLKLYKALASLMAHVSYVIYEHEAERVYNRHTIWALRRELSYPKLLLAGFEPNSGGIKLTYESMLAIHFWFSIIVLSIVLNVQSLDADKQGINIFHDPLGVYHNLR